MTKITFDKQREVFNTLGSKQFDSSEPFKAEFLNGGEPIDLSQYNIRFECKKPDGNIVIDDEDITIKNICEIEMYLNEQVTVVNGKLDCQFVLVHKVNEKQNTTFTFYMDVQQSALGVGGYSFSLITILERLNKSIIKGEILHKDLTSDIAIADPLQKDLRKDINEANTFREQLNKDVETGVLIKDEIRENTIDATNVNAELLHSKELAQSSVDTIRGTGNYSKVILPSDWIGTEPNLTYAWNHGLKTKNISVDVFDEVTGETLFWSVTATDIDNISIQSKTRRHLRVVLSAKYYSGGMDSKEKIDEVGVELVKVNASLDKIDQQKASKEELNALGQLKLDGTYSTLVDLQTALPTGATGLYLVTGDGWTYRWDGSSWVKASLFQSIEIADKQVKIGKLSQDIQDGLEYFNTLKEIAFTQNLGSFYSRFSGALIESSYFEYTDILASAGDTFYVTLRTGANVAGVIFRDSKNSVISTLYANGTDVVITDQKIIAPSGTASISLSSRNNTNPLKIKKAEVLGELKKGAIIGDKVITYNKLNDDLISYLSYKPFGYIEKPTVVFVCDDGEQETLTYVKPISLTKEIPFVSACWNDSVMLNSTNITETLGLITDNGWEIAHHYNSHINTLTTEQLISIFNTEIMNITAKGITIKNFVYPYNETTDLLKLICSKYFNICASGTLSGTFKENTKRSNIFNMSRRKIQGATGLSAYKTMIDGAVTNKQILIFYFHGNELADSTNLTRLNEVIDYCKSRNMFITTLQGLFDM